MDIRFDDQKILVVGASRGIGRAIAKGFVESGGRVIAVDILEQELEPLRTEMENSFLTLCGMDVTSEGSVRDTVAKTAGTEGRIDILVYVAGGIVGRKKQHLEDVALSDFDAVVDVNLRGAFLTMRSVLPFMKARSFGRIVVITSPAGLRTSLTGIQSYAASKHAQVGLVKQVAQEVGQFGITVNGVAPGFMTTSPDYERQWNSYSDEFRANFANSIAMRRMGKPEDVANVVLFLASDRASFLTGQILPVTGTPL